MESILTLENLLTIERYNGKDIWIGDFSNLEHRDIEKLLDLQLKQMKNSGKHDILLLHRVHNVKLNQSTGETLKKFGNAASPFVAKFAAVGVTGIAKIFATSLRILRIIDVKFCDTDLDAKKYLVAG